MKRVIDGKRYNTDTASEVASWDNGCGGGDFHRCEETLYRTKKGNYFLAGSGGAMSRWAESLEGGRCSTSGVGMEALSPESALEWLEDHGKDIPDGCPELSALVVDA